MEENDDSCQKKADWYMAHGKQSIKVNYSFYFRKTATSIPSQFGFFIPSRFADHILLFLLYII